MRERVLLNDQGLYVDCIVENGRISFEFESGLETLNDKVQLYKDGSVTYGLLGLKRFIRISKERISRVMRITTTEARMLCALSHRVDDLFKRKLIKDKSLVKEFYRNLKELYALPKGWSDKQIHHTELHTHFIEILNAEEFIKFINQYNVTYPINEDGNLDFKKGIPLTYQELVSLGYKEKLINSLRLDITKQSEFSDLTDVVNNNRRSLLQRIIDHNYDAVMKDRENEEFISSDEDIKRIVEIIDKNIKEASDDILNGKFTINPKIINGINESCKYCKYQDICYLEEKDKVYLNTEEGDDDGDRGTEISD